MPNLPPKYTTTSPAANVVVNAVSIEAERERNRDKRWRYDRQWVKVREMKLRRDPLCDLCQQQGLIIAADVVHHLVDVVERPDLRLVLSNLQSLCETHHNRITARNQHKAHP